jgi:hypothetical protein
MRRNLLVMLGLGLVVLACDSPATPPPVTQPAPPAPPAPATVKALTINGPARVAPAEKPAYEAIATFTDGTTQIYTSKVQWRSPCPYILPIASGGQATAAGIGECVITAGLGSVQSSLNVMVVPAGTFRLAGRVLEAGLPMIGATVKATTGQGVRLQQTTDSTGQYRFYGVAGSVDVQVSKAGYTTVTKSVVVGADELLDFPDLSQTGAVATISGAYTLTLTMAPQCVATLSRFQAMPSEGGTRTYSAVVAQDGPRLTVSLSGGRFQSAGGRGRQFEGHIEPGGISFKLGSLGGYSYYYGYYYHAGIPDVAEQLSNGDYLSYLGTANTPASPAGMSGTLHGIAMVFTANADGTPGRSSMCWGDHQFSLTPQTAATRIRR